MCCLTFFDREIPNERWVAIIVSVKQPAYYGNMQP